MGVLETELYASGGPQRGSLSAEQTHQEYKPWRQLVAAGLIAVAIMMSGIAGLSVVVNR